MHYIIYYATQNYTRLYEIKLSSIVLYYSTLYFPMHD
jgi:hypothetical protein